jgi:hypothetical protein
MPPPWANVAQARIIGELHGSQTVNVMHFANNVAAADLTAINAQLQQLVEALIDCVRTTLLPAVTADWNIVRCEANRLHPAPSDPIVATANAGEVGELSSTSVSFAASLMHLRTGQGGRRGRGKVFLPPPGEAETTASSIDPATGLLLVQFAVCMAGKFGTSNPTTDWRLGVLSTTDLDEVAGSYDTAFRQVQQLTPGTVLAVMRSRKKGVGS